MLLSLAFLPTLLLSVYASGTANVNCTISSLSWSFNAERQSPCQVAANLAAVCSPDGNYRIPALNPIANNFYTPQIIPSTCECSTVVYNLAAACGLCQGGTFALWAIWRENCTSTITPGVFPSPLPPQTGVPHWAYNDPTASNFNAAANQQTGDQPESSASTNPTTPTSTTPTNAATTTSASNKKSNTGAIAGGVVGGVAALAILGGLLFFFLRRRNTTHAEQPMKYQGAPQSLVSPSPPPASSPKAPTSPYHKPYDPNDPSTFPPDLNAPPSPGPYAMQHNSNAPFANSQYAASYNSNGQRPVGYSGVAEV